MLLLVVVLCCRSDSPSLADIPRPRATANQRRSEPLGETGPLRGPGLIFVGV